MAAVSSLCDTCKEVLSCRFFPLYSPPEPGFPQPEFPQAIKKEFYHPENGATSGCPLCILFLSIMSQNEIEDLRHYVTGNFLEEGKPVRRRKNITRWVFRAHKEMEAERYRSVFKHRCDLFDGCYRINLTYEGVNKSWKKFLTKEISIIPDSKLSCYAGGVTLMVG
jgi:hypothetical protein